MQRGFFAFISLLSVMVTGQVLLNCTCTQDSESGLYKIGINCQNLSSPTFGALYTYNPVDTKQCTPNLGGRLLQPLQSPSPATYYLWSSLEMTDEDVYYCALWTGNIGSHDDFECSALLGSLPVVCESVPNINYTHSNWTHPGAWQGALIDNGHGFDAILVFFWSIMRFFDCFFGVLCKTTLPYAFLWQLFTCRREGT